MLCGSRVGSEECVGGPRRVVKASRNEFVGFGEIRWWLAYGPPQLILSGT